MRPPAGGQSLKQNYDLDQVKGMLFNNVVNFTEILLLSDLGRFAHWDRAGLSEALHVQDEVGLPSSHSLIHLT